MFQLSEQQSMVQQMVRQWCERTLLPKIPALEAGEEMPWDLMRLVPERMRALDHRNVPVLREAEPQYPPTTEWKIEIVRAKPGVRT